VQVYLKIKNASNGVLGGIKMVSFLIKLWVTLIVIIMVVCVWACCKVAGDADRQEENTMKYWKWCGHDCIYCAVREKCKLADTTAYSKYCDDRCLDCSEKPYCKLADK
jgi:hypothetical protein